MQPQFQPPSPTANRQPLPVQLQELQPPFPDLAASLESGVMQLAQPAAATQDVQLDFEDLTACESVQDQYGHLGLRFEGAIALQPSNPAFRPRSGQTALIPANTTPGITIHFRSSPQRIGAFVAGTRPVSLAAFDASHKLLSRQSIGQRRPLKDQADLTPSLPQQQLEVSGHNIARVVFSSDAPFILDDFFMAIA